MKHIAVGGISIENGTFSTLPTRLSDFVIRRGAELLASDRYPFLDRYDAVFVPTLHADALPGGPLERAAYDRLKNELLQRLADAMPLDGLYLDLHGAMYVDGMFDAELDLARSAREVVGDDCLISASMDLHGNISRAFTEQIDMLSAYRTAPHEDVVATREKAVALLLRCLSEGVRPSVAWVGIPVALPGERTSTAVEPARGIYAALGESDAADGVLDASLFVGFVWADEPRTGAAAVVSGLDAGVAAREARRIARRYWDARFDFDLAVEAGTIDECIKRGVAAPESTVFISDSGDNPTAGAAGDSPLFLARLLALDVSDALVASIVDADAVATCWSAGSGANVQLSLGGKLDTRQEPLPVSARVVRTVEGIAQSGRQACIIVDGITVIVTERRSAFQTRQYFEAAGVDPLDYKVVVVKLGYLFPELAAMAPLALMALSPGASDLDIPRLPFEQVRRPLFPLDPEMQWQPA